jgi:hypothetical protein
VRPKKLHGRNIWTPPIDGIFCTGSGIILVQASSGREGYQGAIRNHLSERISYETFLAPSRFFTLNGLWQDNLVSMLRSIRAAVADSQGPGRLWVTEVDSDEARNWLMGAG